MYDDAPESSNPRSPIRQLPPSVNYPPAHYYPYSAPPLPARLTPSDNWRFVDQVLIWVGIFGTLLLTFYGTRWGLRQAIGPESNTPEMVFSIEAFAYFMAYIWVFIIGIGLALGLEKSWADMGFRWPQQPLPWAIGGLLIGWVLIPVRLALILVLMVIFDPDGLLAQEESEQWGDQITGWLMVAFLQSFVMLVVLAPLVEEFVFRGLLQPWLRRRFGIVLSILGSGILFGLAHQELWLTISNIVMGIVLASIYEYTGSLWVTIWIHFVNNATVVAIIVALVLLLGLASI